jgi:hypothetical protein
MIRSRIIRWAGHTSSMEEKGKNAYNVLVGKPEEKDVIRETLDVDGRIILNGSERNKMGE